MPYLTLIEYGSRRVGLVHSPGAADYEEHWEQIWKQAESVPAPGARGHEPARQQLEYALLWRDLRRRAATHDDPKLDEALEGVDLVITGHCPSLWPTWTRRNVITIDTGVHYEALGHLTRRGNPGRAHAPPRRPHGDVPANREIAQMNPEER